MQEPVTGSASCGGKAIYADCDKADPAHLNSMSMELMTAIEKLLGEPLIPLDCANPASYDQLCRAILKAISNAGCEAAPATVGQLTTICDDLENHFVVTWLANGTPVRIPLSKFGEMEPGGGGGGGACAADDDGVVRAIGDPYVQWQGSWVDTVPFASTAHGTPPPGAHPSPGAAYSIPAPTNQAPQDIYGGTWVSGGTVVVQQNSENANLTCTTWTKTAC